MRPARSLQARALQYLAQREHSRVELRRKLLRRAEQDAAARAAGDGDASVDEESAGAAAATAVDAVLDWLEAHHYLSAARFVESRVHARSARFGNLRIRQELAQHDVQLTADAQQRLRDTEYERALAVWTRKFGGSSSRSREDSDSEPSPQRTSGSPAEQARMTRFLASRGFSGEVIRQVLRRAGTPGEDVPSSGRE